MEALGLHIESHMDTLVQEEVSFHRHHKAKRFWLDWHNQSFLMTTQLNCFASKKKKKTRHLGSLAIVALLKSLLCFNTGQARYITPKF